MTRILVAHATKTGCTAGVAEKIAETLTAAGADVTVAPTSDKLDVAAFDAVVLGSGVRAGKWHGSARKLLDRDAAALTGKPLALFTVCLTMADTPEKADEVRAYTEPLLQKAGLRPVDVGLFAGWFVPEHFGFVGRTILKKMGATEGDHREWDKIEAWAREIAPRLMV